MSPDSQRQLQRAVQLHQAGRLVEAVANYDAFLAAEPQFALAHHNRAIALSALNRREEALAGFSKAVAADPALADAHNNRGSLLQDLGRHGEALAAFDAALAIRPDFLTAHYNRGNALQFLQRMADALASYDRALALDPGIAEFWNGRGTALRNLDRQAEAIKSYDQALLLKPAFGEAAYNRGIVLSEAGHHEAALASYDLAIRAGSHVAAARRNQGVCHLLLGRLDPGWALYEWRKKTEDAALFRTFRQPQWLGREDIAGKTLFLHWEQGLGDTIQFSRYAALCQARGAHVVLSVQQPLLALLQQNNPAITVIGPDETPAQFDFHCSLMSLPLALRTTLDTIPAQPHLKAGAQLRNTWAGRLGPRSRPRIGVAWRGSAAHKDDRNRSMTLEQLLPLLDPQMDFISLQKDVTAEEMALLKASGLFKLFGPEQQDFHDTAALVDLLDLVITVDTAVAHLAGAMGKPVWILLSSNPDWRWLRDRDDSAWYPSARLFRQQQIQSWPPLIAQVGRALLSGNFTGGD